MVSIKQEVAELLERLPDDCSIEDVQYPLYVSQEDPAWVEDVEQGRTHSVAEVEQKHGQWRRTM